MMVEHGGKVSYEPRDWRLKVVLWTGLGVVLFGLFGFLYSAVFMWVYQPHEGRIAELTTPEQIVQEFPEPRLRPIENMQWNAVRQEALQRLHSYGWVDPVRGIVHIPIERAIDLVAERGLPTRENPRRLDLEPVPALQLQPAPHEGE
ncbi:MAG: hypothetical protein KatS3mg115_2375 [Candidatus Poribacteria bacterium]|nr:MAG: hypothetical protein KatS3mg115_2375 [Candidatus Poribacteria bacterium]